MISVSINPSFTEGFGSRSEGTDQLLVRNPRPHTLPQQRINALHGVVLDVPLVQPERELVYVALEMLPTE